jgi:hypothetical protein
MRRLLALLGAVAMIVGALALHGDLSSDGGSGGSGGASTGRLLCASELAAACQQLSDETGVKFDVQAAGDTVALLSTLTDGRTFEYDGWLTTGREAEIVRDARTRAQLSAVLGAPLGPIARTPLMLAIWKDRAAALSNRCGGTLKWKCLGDVAGVRWSSLGGDGAWGDVKPGHADPQATGEGLAIIGQAASQYFGRSDLSTADYEDSGFLDWFTRLERAVPSGAGVGDESDFVRMLTAGPSVYDVVATTEAEAGPLLANAARDRRDAVTLLYPAPVATLDIVFAPVADRDTGLQDTVTGDDGRAALAHAGFRVDGEDRPLGVPSRPPLPTKSNLPDAGSLSALLQTWREVTG